MAYMLYETHYGKNIIETRETEKLKSFNIDIPLAVFMNFFQLPGPCVFCHSQQCPAFCKCSKKSSKPLGKPLINSHECPSSGNRNGSCRSTSSSSCSCLPSCFSTSSAVFCAIDIKLLHSCVLSADSFGASK